MSYDIRMAKLVTGEVIIGKFNGEAIEEPALLQAVPMREQGNVQMIMLPYGYPFEEKFTGKIDSRNILFQFSKLPDGLEAKYLEAVTNLTISGISSMQMKDSKPFGGPIIH